MKKHYLLLTCLTVSLLLFGCMEKDMFKDIHIYPDTTLPIGSFEISDSSLFAQANMEPETDQNGVLQFSFKNSVSFVEESDIARIFTFPTQYFRFEIPSFPARVEGDKIDIPSDISIDVDLQLGDDESVTNIAFSRIAAIVAIDGVDMSTVRCRIPQIKDADGNAFEYRHNVINYSGQYQLDTDTGQVTLEFSGLPSSSRNGYFEFTINGTSHAEGFFGNKVVDQTSTKVSLSEEFTDFAQKSEYAYFSNPAIEFDVFNKFNIPIMIKMDSFDVNGQRVELKDIFGVSRILIKPGDVTKVRFTNASTVNGHGLSDVFNKDMKDVNIEVSSIINPTAQQLGDPTYVAPTTNSLSITDRLTGDYGVEIPMEGVLQDVKFDNVIDLDLSGMKMDELKYKQIDLTMTAENKMPLEVKLSAYVTHNNQSDGVRTYITQQPIVVPSTRNNLKANDPNLLPGIINKDNMVVITLNEQVVDQFLNSESLFFEINASTKDALSREIIKIYSPSRIDMHVVLGAKGDYTIQ